MPELLHQLHWQQLQHPVLSQTQTELWICQLQSKVPELAGNKWLKLKYHIQQLQQHDHAGIVSFGGAFSNHLLALAAAGHHYGFATHALVRSHQPDSDNPTLKQCQAFGMQFTFLSAQDYRRRTENEFLYQLQKNWPNWLIVPEGGTSTTAMRGVSELPLQHTPAGRANLLACACASGGTLAGIIQAADPCQVLGVAVVKDDSLVAKVTELLPSAYHNWQLWPEITQSKYAQFRTETLDLCLELSTQQIQLEPIYTGKALASVLTWLASGKIAGQQRISFFHTGGLQGLAGLLYRKKLTLAQYQQITHGKGFAE